MQSARRKAFAYITYGDRLLVFGHPFAPDAGIQVPAGTMRDGERPADAVMREAWEETGLSGLQLVRFLGQIRRDMADFGLHEVHHRYFFHLRCTTPPPETWRHLESDPADGSASPIVFDFFWTRLPDEAPELIAGHGAMIPRLVELMAEGRNADLNSISPCYHERDGGHAMVAERKSQAELTYEEQVAIARANFQRNQEEHRKWIAEWVAENGDPAEALDDFMRKTYDKDALLQVWREWRKERGKPDLEEW